MGEYGGADVTHIAPCTRCPLKQGCELRDEFRARVRGLGASSVRFKCSRLAAEIRIGRRVIIRATILEECSYSDGDEYGSIIRHYEVAATVTTAYPDYSFAATIDQGALESSMGGERDNWFEDVPTEQVNKRRFRRKQKHIRIVRFLNEPDRQFCSAYKILLLPDGSCDHHPNGECCRNASRLLDDADMWAQP